MVKNSSIEIQLKDNDNNDLSFLSEYDYKIDNNSLKIFTDTPNLELPSIILKFSEKGIKIEDIHIPQTSLEDVFLDLTGRKIND
jgi:ABC-2 type transport system ATP-binding protein